MGEESEAQTQELLKAEEAIMCELGEEIRTHTPPPVVIGAGRGTLIDKFCATAHALFLESGDMTTLSSVCKDVVSITTDLGTEHRLASTPAFPAVALFPWWRGPCRNPQPAEPGEAQMNIGLGVGPDEDFEVGSQDSAAANPEAQQLERDVPISFRRAMPIAGLLHVIHNAGNDLEDAINTLGDTIEGLQNVANLLRTRGSRDRLLETCFSDAVGRHLHKDLQQFCGKVHKKRWGTVAFCVCRILELERSLRWGWSKEKYEAGRAIQPQADHPGGVRLDIADQALSSSRWWASLHVLDRLFDIVRACLVWAEGCPCHENLSADALNVPAKAEEAWARCPLRGRRAPELANGDFFKLLDALCERESHNVLCEMPSDITESDRAELLVEFEKGRAHLVFTMTLKLSHWSEPPWLVFAAAHHKASVSRAAVARSLRAQCTHERYLKLQSSEIADEARQYISDAAPDVFELPALASYLGELRFAYTAERLVEGSHAMVHRAVMPAPSHSAPYVSFSKRVGEIRAALGDGTEALAAFAQLLHMARSPAKALKQLNLSDHPSCRHVKSNRDPIHWKIVYRCDPYSLYTQARPEIPDDGQPPDAGSHQHCFIYSSSPSS